MLSLDDVDWYGFTVTDTASLSFFASFSNGAGADGVMQIVDDFGDVIAFDDDSGVGLLPAIQIANLAAGTYYIGFSGYGDADITSIGTDELLDGVGHTGFTGGSLWIAPRQGIVAALCSNRVHPSVEGGAVPGATGPKTIAFRRFRPRLFTAIVDALYAEGRWS